MTKKSKKYHAYSKTKNNIRKKNIFNYKFRNFTQKNKKYKHVKRGAGPDEDRLEAQQKIGQFMLQNRDKIRSKYLQTICEDSGACISFGMEVNKINELFDNFVNFKYALSPVISIGGVTQNGFIKQIQYNRNDYECYAILKSSLEQDSDNLMYEYEVGFNYINKQSKIFPCFIETYGLFLYKDEDSWLNSMETEEMKIEDLKNNLILQNNIDYTIGCPQSKYIALLIQHVKNAKTFTDFTKNLFQKKNPVPKNEIILINTQLPYIFYQIYMPLATLANQFTHYDLHSNNVLLYTIGPNKHITFHYYLSSGKIVEFNSRFIVKIIDYGRCYYNNGSQSSLDTYNKICNTVECGPKRDSECGGEFGFSILSPDEGEFYNITSHKKNISIDMRFIVNFIEKSPLNYDVDNLMQVFYKKIQYDKPDFFQPSFGTSEKLKSGKIYNKINNVIDLYEELGDIINKRYEVDKKINSLSSKVGDFHIYQDGRPMEFIKA